MSGGAFVPELVEVLFDLVPALRAARRTYCFRVAENSGTETIGEGLAGASTGPASAVVSRDGVGRKLNAVGEVFGKRDEVATKEGRGVGL